MKEGTRESTGHEASEPEKFDLRSHVLAEAKRQDLLRLFPEAHTEGGKIDFERLKLALGEAVDVGKERYGLTWPGKADCFKAVQSPSLGTLRPCREESVDFDCTENLIVEGDNLEVLKLLQKAYMGKVKMIYIDPPYNTGSDFIYPDDYSESLQTYLEYTGQVDAEGKKFSTNTEADGRFHSKWLSMMYPRLYLARNLLREDGLIFVSIDDGEAKTLRAIMDEIFGEEHFIAAVAWEKRYTRSNNARLFYSLKDLILVYRKSEAVSLLREPRTEKSTDIYSNPDNDPRGDWTSSSYVNPATRNERPNLAYPINHPITNEPVEHPTHAWKYEKAEHLRHVRENRLWWGQRGDAKFPRLKTFLSERSEGIVPIDLWDYKSTGTTDDGGLEVKDLFGGVVFDNPKPTSLIKRMMSLFSEGGPDKNAVVLDFFAGSGSTAHAVLDLNKQDGGSRKFVLIQLPELTERSDYRTVSDITKERVRRVLNKQRAADGAQLSFDRTAPQGGGFRVFKLTESNFKSWNAGTPRDTPELEAQLALHVNHIREGRSDDDLLFELLLKSGFPLTTAIEKVTLEGKSVYSVSGGAMLVCLERELTLSLIRAMAEQKPERVICLDEGFTGNDQLKANAVQIFKTKGVTSFRTV